MDNLTLGEKLMLLRRRAGLLQEELAEKSGVSRTTIISAEKGLTEPTLPNLRCIANALDCTVEELKGE